MKKILNQFITLTRLKIDDELNDDDLDDPDFDESDLEFDDDEIDEGDVIELDEQNDTFDSISKKIQYFHFKTFLNIFNPNRSYHVKSKEIN